MWRKLPRLKTQVETGRPFARQTPTGAMIDLHGSENITSQNYYELEFG